MRHHGVGVHCRAVASTPARAGPSPRQWGRPGPATGVAWGTSGSCLRPFRLLGQQGAASSYVETPTWKNRRALDQGSRGTCLRCSNDESLSFRTENIVAQPGLRVSFLPALDAEYSPWTASLHPSATPAAVSIPINRHAPQKLASRASNRVQSWCIKTAKHKGSRTQPWARAASASPSSSLRRTRIC